MNKKERAFVGLVKDFYTAHSRDYLPWRKTKDPYKIMVSEIMLQQTQVDRVIPKYKKFIKKFPSAAALAKADLSEVIQEWQGLGYNRRARYLYEACQVIVKLDGGKFPKNNRDIQNLPGVGPYTAAAIRAFAYNEPVVLIETNVRTVYLHHFFKKRENVADAEILELVERTLDTEDPKTWYAALMDYGSYLKKKIGNQNGRSKHYVKQSKFKGSNREVRGEIIRALIVAPRTKIELIRITRKTKKAVTKPLQDLLKEGMIVVKKGRYRLP